MTGPACVRVSVRAHAHAFGAVEGTMIRIMGRDELLRGEGIECQLTEAEFHFVGSDEPWKPSEVIPEWLAE